MKYLLLFTLGILPLSLFTYSQQISDFSQVLALKKGKIILKDEQSMDFRNIRVLNDSIVFTNSHYGICKYPINDISEVYKSKNKLIGGMLFGGVTGLVTSILAPLIYMTPDQRKEDKDFIMTMSYIYIGSGIIIGGIVGGFLKKYKIIYRNTSLINLQPGLGIYQDNKTVFLLTCRITIK